MGLLRVTIHFVFVFCTSIINVPSLNLFKFIKYIFLLLFCIFIGAIFNDFLDLGVEIGKILFLMLMYKNIQKSTNVKHKYKLIYKLIIGYMLYVQVVPLVDAMAYLIITSQSRIFCTWYEYIFIELVSILLTIYFMDILNKFFEQQSFRDSEYKILIIFLIILYLINMCYLDIIFRTNLYSDFIGVTLLVLIVLLMILFYFGVYFRSKFLKLLDEKLRLQHINDLEQYTQDLEKNQINLRRFKHDYKNLIIHIEQLVAEQKYDTLKNYLAEIHSYSQTYLTLSHDYSDGLTNIKIDALKNIILNKLLKMESKNIPVYLECLKPVENVVLSDMDTVRIFGVLLDNAIESLEIQTNGKFEMLIISEDDYLEFELKNTVEDMDISLSNLMDVGYSTKAKDRGIGLASVKQILTKYPDIELDMVIENQWFIVSLIIPKG